MSNADTVKVLDFAARAAATNENHWLKYEALVRRAFPDGISIQQEQMLRAAFSKAWQAADDAGFKRGIQFSNRVYGTGPAPS